MKISSEPPGQPPIDRSKAWSCLVTNLLVFPGLGSVMAGWKRGYVQMAVAVIGTVVTMVALVRIVLLWAREFLLPNDPDLYTTAILGIAVFLVSWCWSLCTSLALFRAKP